MNESPNVPGTSAAGSAPGEVAVATSAGGEAAIGGYRVLARKYRPTSFAGLIGQEALVRTLTNALASGRLAHAFMLSGVRGIGKTTTARIIARSLNCIGEDGRGGPTAAPCGVCCHCVAIGGDRHMDVIEMDAASRTGVDEIRELLDGTRYRPTSARYKIYIIDEVHMLSRNAFNALLKTLEEPPAHVRFVFATTEIRKVPITVLSRCQRFDLRRVDAEVLVGHLASIAAREQVVVKEAALHLIARAADGSVRDGLSLLDQAIAHCGGSVDDDAVRRILGLADRTVTFDLVDAVLRGEIATALELLAEQYRAGADPVEILTDMLELTHWLTRIKVVPSCADAAGVAEAERVRGRAMAEKLAMGEATRLWQMLLKGLGETRLAPSPVQAAEMVLIRIGYAARLPTPADALRGARSGGGNSGEAGEAASSRSSGRSPSVQATSAAQTIGQHETAAVPASSRGPPASALSSVQTATAEIIRAPAAPALGEHRGAGPGARPTPDASAGESTSALTSFAEAVELAREEREAILYGQLIADVHLVRFKPGHVEIRLSGGAPADLVRRLREFLHRQTGQPWLVSISREEGRPTILEQRRREEAERRQRVEAEPLVQAVLAAFPGARLGEVRVAAEPPRPVGDVEDDDADEPDAEEAGASDNGEHDAVFENGVDAED